jgi:60 kDa SS-A/Ro ribonucleoprotein
MALVSANLESSYAIYGFGSTYRELDISPNQRLDDAMRRMSDQHFGSTDASLAMKYALAHKMEIDAFVVITDNEINRGTHPAQALNEYRQKTGIPTKLVVVGMTATDFTIADPKDAGMLDVVGFDTNAPSVIADFIRG